MDGHIDVAPVKEFYANLYDPEDKSPKQVRVRGKLIKFDAASLSTFLETPLVIQQGEQYTSYSLFRRTRTNPQELASKLCIPGRESALEAPEEGSNNTSLDLEYVIILQPRPHFSYVRFEYGQGEVSLWASYEDGHGRGLIHITPDFSDGPVQLLAAWLPNPHHNLVHSLRRTRKARARGSEGSSSSAPLAPASTPPAHSAPAPPPSASVPTPSGTFMQSSDILSLHHGLRMVMQSIHDLAQHRPIMSMKEFIAQVAWPGVQPSPLGGGEASVAQEPQLDVTLETASRTSPVTTPGIEVSDEEDGAVDTDYAADMATAQSTWDPWPTGAQETPQPAQDAPSLSQDEPTPAQKEP
ncbi:hypothetical protein GmHk_15G044200 [Glycine max]|nr:hypothetical protein GmHk_15G044200 [Glycine max]